LSIGTIKMQAPHFFHSIKIATPRDAIYTRLGYKKGMTQIDSALSDEIERYIDEALSLMDLRGSALILTIEDRSETEIHLEGGVLLESVSLAWMLVGSAEVLIMAATAGERIMSAITADVVGANVTRGVVLDAAASEVVDAALDWIMAYYNQTLLRQRKTLTKRRFSAGYGDFALENQRLIYNLLMLERIGVSITGSCILVPEKSVSALAGIRGGGA
jgi:hypothetical protein